MFEHMIVVIQPAASEHFILDSYHESAGGDVETGKNNIEGTTDGRAVLIEKLLKEHTDKQNGAAQKENGPLGRDLWFSSFPICLASSIQNNAFTDSNPAT